MKLAFTIPLGWDFLLQERITYVWPKKAEELGYHSVWLGDHIVIPEKIVAPLPLHQRWIGGLSTSPRGLTRSFF
jgi:alkanesulfonate monooxygenase SsuD/methylene tetrahydromethanopterin reductase-like flavin-dependent oxidoreductase (luciferase family)